MSLRVDTAWLITSLLLSVRVAAAISLAPIFGPAKVPAAVQVLLAIVLGMFIVSTLAAPPREVRSVGELALAAVTEAAIGLAFSFGFLAAYAATQVAGRALDVQIGFGAASVLNPATQNLSPLIGSIFGMVMVVVFLALDGHHVLLRALAASAIAVPPNSGRAINFILVIEQSAVMFTFGLVLAAPILFVLWLSDVAMAVFARSMPQLNVFVLSFAVKIVLGTVGLALSIGATRVVFDRIFDSTFRYWERLSVVN